MKKLYLFLFVAFLLLAPSFSQAATVCADNTTLNFVARDPNGNFIPKATVEVYKQEKDANGASKPTTRFASIVSSSVLGTAKLTWKNSALSSDTYAVKVSTINNTNASFWYYDLTLACGETADLSKTLSGVNIILHDLNGNLLTNTNFSIYSQIYNTDGEAQKQKKALITTLNSGVSGEVTAYLPQGSLRSIDKAYSDEYTFELTRGTNKFIYYGIKVIDGQLTTFNYYISSLKVKLQDVTGTSYPANTKVEVYKQGVGANNDHQKGDKVGDLVLASDGRGTFEVPAGLYVLGVKNSSGQYQYFWDMQVEEGRGAEYTATSNEQGANSTGSLSASTLICPNNSQFNLILRNINGAIVPALKFELYEQKSDANGLLIAGAKVIGGTVDKAGRATLNFKPDPRQTYALKIYDKNANVGDYWFYNAVRYVCDANRTVTKSIPSLKIILRDKNGVLKRNFSFSLYAQKYDIDNKPMFESADLVANLKTDSGGSALVYVAPFNDYRVGQSGLYVVSAKDGSGNIVNVYDINISGNKDLTFSYSFSSLSGRLLDAARTPQANKNISLYEVIGDASDRTLGRQLLKAKTDASGGFAFDYPAGTYALVNGDQLIQSNIFWNITIKSQTNNNITLTTDGKITSSTLPKPTVASKPTASVNTSSANSNNSANSASNSGISLAMSKTLAGRILLQVKDKGQAWYINPLDYKRYYLGRSDDAYNLMRKLGLGISNKNFDALQLKSNKSLLGKILIKVEDSGRAYYYNPLDAKLYYLGRPDDAFRVIRSLGLGISTANLNKIGVAN